MRRNPAHSRNGCIRGFESTTELLIFCMWVTSPRYTVARIFKNRYPSPSMRSGLPQAGPQLLTSWRRFVANCGFDISNYLPSAGGSITCAPIITNGGGTLCAEFYRSWQWHRPLALRPAEIRRASKPLSAEVWVPARRSCSTRTHLLAPQLAQARTCSIATRTPASADNLDTDGGRSRLPFNHSGAGSAFSGAGVFLFVRTEKPEKGDRCSRRS